MNNELILAVADKLNITQKEAKSILQAVSQSIVETIITQKQVKISKLGTFRYSLRKAKQDSEELVPVVTFRTSSSLKSDLRTNYLVNK